MFCCHGHKCLSKFYPVTAGPDVEQKAMVMYLFHLLLAYTLLLCPHGDHYLQILLEKCEGFLLEVHQNWKI